MFRDLFEIIAEGIKRVFTSRLLVIAVAFCIMFSLLVYKLFDLQVIQGTDYLSDYVNMTETSILTSSTRGNIYDCNGEVIAYNQLAYAVTVGDSGVYEDGYAKNEMLIRLIDILNEHNEEVISNLSLGIDKNGEFYYTTVSESGRLAFLRDVYGLTSINDLDKENDKGEIENSSNATAKEIFLMLKEKYGVGVDRKGNPYEINDENALKLINIRYGMALNSYQKYNTTKVASNISEETKADVLEHTNILLDVQVEEEVIRVYNESEAFAHIIGYTGKASAAELEELSDEDSTYELNDIVGKAGIEQSMELKLKGTKGSQTMYLDSTGIILGVTDVVEPVAGDNIYLTIDMKTQVGIYNLIEQELAGILSTKIVNEGLEVADVETVGGDASKLRIPIKTAYFQLINNNVLSCRHFASEEASETEAAIYQTFTVRQQEVISGLSEQLVSAAPVIYQQLPEEMQDYQQRVYDYLEENNFFNKDKIDTDDETYKSWVAGTISLKDFLYHGLSYQWINTSGLDISEKYSSTDEAYQILINYICSEIQNDIEFTKLIYKRLIYNDQISGNQLCLALFDQGVLVYDEASVARLLSGNAKTAFDFFMEKVSNIELTPAMLALDPCSGSCVVTDITTGQVKALVTYPGYDINRLSGTIDAAYYAQLSDDLSKPFLNRATQVETAPGSIFKVLSAIMGMNEQIIGVDDLIDDTGLFDKQGMRLRCWYTSGHGPLNVSSALQHSCNYFFCEVGYQVSLQNGEYNETVGLATIKKYAEMFGLGGKSGVEIAESQPHITDENPIPSAIGQGSHTFANIHLSRYLTALASSGTLYQYSLIDKVTSYVGDVKETYTSNVESQIELPSYIWDEVHKGMRAVITDSTVTDFFRNSSVAVAGKTGTAEEQKTRANHATFIGYAPYEAPQVGVTVSIPNGYGSGNSAELASDVFEFYFGTLSYETIMEGSARKVTNSSVGD